MNKYYFRLEDYKAYDLTCLQCKKCKTMLVSTHRYDFV